MDERDLVSVGKIKLGKKVMVSDPCYKIGTWCQGVLDIKPGEYQCYVAHNKEGRVALVEVRHIEHSDPYYLDIAPFDVGVDSGLAGFFDMKYYESVKETAERADKWYDGVCDAENINGHRVHILDELCFFGSSGYGDGGYECKLCKVNDEIVALKIEFIDEEYEFEDEYEDDNDDETDNEDEDNNL